MKREKPHVKKVFLGWFKESGAIGPVVQTPDTASQEGETLRVAIQPQLESTAARLFYNDSNILGGSPASHDLLSREVRIEIEFVPFSGTSVHSRVHSEPIGFRPLAQRESVCR